MLEQAPRAGGLVPYLRLMRPPNLATAAADALAGFAVAAAVAPWTAIAPLAFAAVALYAGGVVLNDVFDARLDAVERPERPIPSGAADRRTASVLGGGLLALGVATAWLVGPVSALVAGAVAALAVAYDAWGKHRPAIGPVNMGLCRGANLLLGVSAAPAVLTGHWHLAMLPLAYVAAITAVSRGEVAGGSRRAAAIALALMGAALAGLWLVVPDRFWLLPFWLLVAWRVLPAYWQAWRTPTAEASSQAVRAGVLSLIALDAALAAGFAGPLHGLAVLALLPVAARLARAFAVT